MLFLFSERRAEIYREHLRPAVDGGKEDGRETAETARRQGDEGWESGFIKNMKPTSNLKHGKNNTGSCHGD